jgi:hypothetical protein
VDEVAQQSQALLDGLTPELKAQLPKVLFPDACDLKSIEIQGKKRDLRPLPVKYAMQIRTALAPIMGEVDKAAIGNEEGPEKDFDAEEPLLDCLQKAADILISYYKWEIDKDELSLPELQLLATAQVQLNGANDFLLGGLRKCLQYQQIAAIMLIRFQSTLTGLR